MHNQRMKKQKTILIVEDDLFLAKAYEQAFEKLECTITTLYEGGEAFATAKKLQPAVILLDILLPVLDGFEVLKQLKNDPSTRDIPVIIASNLGQESEIETGKELGANNYIVKSDTSITEIGELLKAFL